MKVKELPPFNELLNSVKKGQELEVESLTELQDIFSRSKSNLESMNQEYIPKSLEFQDMEARFMEVCTAVKETLSRSFTILKFQNLVQT
jgi:hypothetical protein